MPAQNQVELSPHETLEVHELLRSDLTGYKKIQKSIEMVQDPELKQFMSDALNYKRGRIEQLQQFISKQVLMIQ